MGRIDEEHVALATDRGLQAGLQLALEELSLGPRVLGQVFWGGTGTGRTRWNFRPMPVRNFRTGLGPRRNPVSWKIRSHASAMVRAGCVSKDSRINS